MLRNKHIYTSNIRRYNTDMNDKKRICEDKIKHLLKLFPAVVVIGARQTGKTTICKKILPDWFYLDLENPKDYDRITYDPLFFFEQYPRNLIIDEAQEHPDIFKVLRGIIDQKRSIKGRFLLTGSSSPKLLSHLSESLAGRIAIVELDTFKTIEYHNRPLGNLYNIFSNKLSLKNISEIIPSLELVNINKSWLCGGYPEPTLSNDESFYLSWMENYRKTYIERDISKLFPKLNKVAYRRFLQILASLSGNIINKAALARDIEVSEKTISEYLHIAEGTFLWRLIPSYEKNTRKSIIKMPKGHFRDTGLLHYLLNIVTENDLMTNTIIGRSFESFVTEELLKGLNSTSITNWYPYYYRTRNGAEIDLILEGNFGTLPIEVKYGKYTKLKYLRTLSKFIDEHQLPFGMLINQADSVEWLTPKIIQIPVGAI